MTKQLRLASAAQTDVGRKRERNQDNVISQIPDDPAILEEKGALFVVCDGMGGHAAGEVASDLGVRTIREIYFATRDQDVITAIAQAVKTANDAIYSLARSHTEYSGMGTTCVTLVVAGGRAYIVNIGDSRAYLIRNNEMRQVTQDHSWVAEQVRFGLLTEEQARVHAHRNVITRSLGTQPSITADLFVETLRDGDRVLLCSDGLHGYVEEDAISQELLTQSDPEVATRNLVDMANANGGPDNISVIVVDVLEAPEAKGPIPLPQNAVDPIEEGTTQPLPTPSSEAPTVVPSLAAAGVAAQSRPGQSGAKPDAPAQGRKRPRRGRVALRVVEVVALILVLFAGWYVGLGPMGQQRMATQRAQSNLAQAQALIAQAQNEPPAQALAALAQARSLTLPLTTNTTIDSATRAQAQTLVNQQLTPAVREVLQRYDAQAHITHLSTASTQSFALNCAPAGQATPAPITSISSLEVVPTQAGKAPIVAGQQIAYFISSGALYQAFLPADAQGVPTAGTATCAPVAVSGVGDYLAMAVSGQTVYALAQQTAGGYSVVTLDSTGTKPVTQPGTAAAVKTATLFSIPATQETPTHLAISPDGKSVYVSYAGGATTPYGLWLYTGQNGQPPSSQTKNPSLTITLPAAATSLLASGNSFYLLLSDGSLGELDTGHLYSSLSVTAEPPAATVDPSQYAAPTPVPALTPTATPAPTATPVTTATAAPTATAKAQATAGSTPAATATPTQAPAAGPGTPFTNGATLASDPQAATLLINDPANDRVVRVAPGAAGQGPNLVAQYVYGAPIANAANLRMVSAGATEYAIAWSGSHLVAFALPGAAA